MSRAEMAGVPVFILEPKEIPAENRNRVLLNLHGGGYVYGPGESGTGEAAVMAGYEHYKVIAVDYRMPPEAFFPAALDDAMTVWRSVSQAGNARRTGFIGTSVMLNGSVSSAWLCTTALTSDRAS